MLVFRNPSKDIIKNIFLDGIGEARDSPRRSTSNGLQVSTAVTMPCTLTCLQTCNKCHHSGQHILADGLILLSTTSAKKARAGMIICDYLRGCAGCLHTARPSRKHQQGWPKR